MTARAPEELDTQAMNVAGRRAAMRDSFKDRYHDRRKRRVCVRGDDHGRAEKGSIYCAPCRVDMKERCQDRYRKTIAGPRRSYRCSRCNGADPRPHSRRSCIAVIKKGTP